MYNRELEGGIILVGRQSLKEYMEGLRRGWRGERLLDSWIQSLDDSVFDDSAAVKSVTEESSSSSSSSPLSTADDVTDGTRAEQATALPTPPRSPAVNLFPLTAPSTTSLSPSLGTPPPLAKLPEPEVLPPLPPAPLSLPPHPPVLLLPYRPDLGFSSIPRSIASWFNTTADVKLGGDAAMAFILGRPETDFAPPTSSENFVPSEDVTLDGGQGGDLDYELKEAEWRVPKNFNKLPTQVDERMKTYYDALKGRVAKAWEIKRGRGRLSSSSFPSLHPSVRSLSPECFR